MSLATNSTGCQKLRNFSNHRSLPMTTSVTEITLRLSAIQVLALVSLPRKWDRTKMMAAGLVRRSNNMASKKGTIRGIKSSPDPNEVFTAWEDRRSGETIICLASGSSSAFALRKWRRHKPPSESFRARFGTDESVDQDIIPIGLSSCTSADRDYQRLAASTRRVPETQHTDTSMEVFMRTRGPVPLGSTAVLPGNYGSIRGICVPRIIMAKLGPNVQSFDFVRVTGEI
ncbi:hypothetical protein F5146DRAFT_1007007 [Armillaria mellea]|nr:hypothetical protein F5146DRAFT_1007007 [Armillaria mellea]